MGAEPIEHALVSRAIEKAQTRVEEQNFEIRKHLLEYDDVLNEQRNFLYAQRDAILRADNLVNRALDACKEMVTTMVQHLELEGNDTEQAKNQVSEALEEQFHFVPELTFQDLHHSTIIESVYQALEHHVLEKITITGEQPFNDFLRYQYLRQIDMRWQNHLDQLEALREAVYLRTYAQKNPLLEYKLEGFDIFDRMIDEIRAYIAVLAVRVQIKSTDGQKRTSPSASAQVVASHTAVSQFSAPTATRTQGAQPGQAAVQIRRTDRKIGRNEPCPCGSGKKYKHCHGKNA
jgi:preprotein translocase subunit SecA